MGDFVVTEDDLAAKFPELLPQLDERQRWLALAPENSGWVNVDCDHHDTAAFAVNRCAAGGMAAAASTVE